jgi:hypothetical protein
MLVSPPEQRLACSSLQFIICPDNFDGIKLSVKRWMGDLK